MKKKFQILTVLILYALQSCSTNECEGIVCPPDGSFQFELIDEETGTNLLTNRAILPEKINIINAERIVGECCDYTNFRGKEVSKAEFQINENTRVYTILVK